MTGFRIRSAMFFAVIYIIPALSEAIFISCIISGTNRTSADDLKTNSKPASEIKLSFISLRTYPNVFFKQEPPLYFFIQFFLFLIISQDKIKSNDKQYKLKY